MDVRLNIDVRLLAPHAGFKVVAATPEYVRTARCRYCGFAAALEGALTDRVFMM